MCVREREEGNEINIECLSCILHEMCETNLSSYLKISFNSDKRLINFTHICYINPCLRYMFRSFCTVNRSSIKFKNHKNCQLYKNFRKIVRSFKKLFQTLSDRIETVGKNRDMYHFYLNKNLL